MRSVSCVVVAVALVFGLGGLGSPRAEGEPKGIWRILVKPKSKWVLKNSEGKDKVVVETYDVRKVGAADVARLRWTHVDGKQQTDIGSSDEGKYTQVAVTPAGLYILSADMDDAAILSALAKKPSRSDPPKQYEASKQNNGCYLSVNAGTVCWGSHPWQKDFQCEDVCDGWVCIDDRGVSELAGTYAPNMSTFTR
jgi:hypothetical protein